MVKTGTVTETYPRGEPSAVGASIPGLSIPEHDHIAMTYTGPNLTGVKYFSMGPESEGGVLRAELVLGYDGNNLVSVTRVEI